MQAIVTTDDAELIVDTVPRPEPLAIEVLIKTSAIGVNPVDWKTRGANVAGPSPIR